MIRELFPSVVCDRISRCRTGPAPCRAIRHPARVWRWTSIPLYLVVIEVDERDGGEIQKRPHLPSSSRGTAGSSPDGDTF